MAQTQNQIQGQITESQKRYLVRIVQGHSLNLHIHNTLTRKQLIVYGADEYVLLSKIIDYLQANGRKRTFITFYNPKRRFYENDAWELELSAEEILSLLIINKHNENSITLEKIRKFLSE